MEDKNKNTALKIVIVALLIFGVFMFIKSIQIFDNNPYFNDEEYLEHMKVWDKCIDDPSNYWDSETDSCKKNLLTEEGTFYDLWDYDRVETINLPRYIQTNDSIIEISECGGINGDFECGGLDFRAMSIRVTYEDCKRGYKIGNTLEYGGDAYYLGENDSLEEHKDFDGVLIPYQDCEIKSWMITNPTFDNSVRIVW